MIDSLADCKILATVNSTAVNMVVHVSVCKSFEHIPSGGIAWSYGKTASSLRNPTLLSIVATLIYMLTHSVCVSPFPTSSAAFAILLLVLAILTGVRWYFIVVWICISLMVTNVEHFFIYWWLFVFLLLRIVDTHCSFLNWAGCF